MRETVRVWVVWVVWVGWFRSKYDLDHRWPAAVISSTIRNNENDESKGSGIGVSHTSGR